MSYQAATDDDTKEQKTEKKNRQLQMVKDGWFDGDLQGRQMAGDG